MKNELITTWRDTWLSMPAPNERNKNKSAHIERLIQQCIEKLESIDDEDIFNLMMVNIIYRNAIIAVMAEPIQ